MELMGGSWGSLGATTPKKLFNLNYWLGHWSILAPFWVSQNGTTSDKNRCLFLDHFLNQCWMNCGINFDYCWGTF